MKAYATIALVLSILVFFWTVMAAVNLGELAIKPAMPYLVGYSACMLAFAVASVFYVTKVERRQLRKAGTP